MEIQHNLQHPSLPGWTPPNEYNPTNNHIQVKMNEDDQYEQWVSASNYFYVSYGLYSAQVPLNYHLWLKFK